MRFPSSCLVLLAISAPSHAEDLQFTDSELHCSLRLPEGWRRLSPEVASRGAAALSMQTGQPVRKVLAWFQRSASPDGAYPYIHITRQICQPPTLNDLAASLRNVSQAAAVKTDRNLRGIVSGSKVSDPEIDADRKMVFLEIEQTVNIGGAGKVKTKLCLFPGKGGVFELGCCTSADDWDRTNPDFDSILDSFAFELGYGYESSLGIDSPTPGFDSFRLLMFGLIGGVVGPFLYKLLKSTNPTCPAGLLRLQLVFSFVLVLSVVELLVYPPNGPVRLTFLLGCAVVGILGLIITWTRGRKGPSTPAGDRPPSMPPPS
jgi:hypothetical protein